ncbi:hypothetical protein DFH27DRAFT_572544, partial [Peziza echinospora]
MTDKGCGFAGCFFLFFAFCLKKICCDGCCVLCVVCMIVRFSSVQFSFVIKLKFIFSVEVDEVVVFEFRFSVFLRVGHRGFSEVCRYDTSDTSDTNRLSLNSTVDYRRYLS